jgi:hypothetical protein
MFELTSFEIFVLAAFFLGGLAKLIPINKECGDISFQKWQAITSFTLFFLYILMRIYIDRETANAGAGIFLFIVYLGFLLFEFSNYLRSNKKEIKRLISPTINFSVLFSETFFLIFSLSQAQLL